MKKVFEYDFRGRKIIVENGEVAKQAHGAVVVRYGDTVILSTVVVGNNANILSDFFPLMVLYQEKLYSVGKIPGGFIKREGRPTDAATLAARMIDRPMRLCSLKILETKYKLLIQFYLLIQIILQN